jgi:hypothetical protein
METLAIKILLALAILGGVFFGGYKKGEEHQKYLTQQSQIVADGKVTTKNISMQDDADTEAKVQIIYRDKIVVKYKTINDGVITYVKTKSSSDILDDEFIRLHNSAATADYQDTTSRSIGGTDATLSATPTVP